MGCPKERLLILAICLSVSLSVVTAGWTSWLDRDDPSASGDWETVADFNNKPCNGLATRIEARIKGDNTVILSSSQRISVGPDYGLGCRNADQYDGRCFNYRVNYRTPPRTSKTFDRDRPSGSGDWELKSLEKGNDWKNGKFILWNANIVNYGLVSERLELGPRYGLVCEKKNQPDNSCQDYEVRFFC
ncbi:mucin-5AC-like [Liolophura sinensis]|uniref:mucin-5AC-like n=1 Tax=Liolophura sinensis TaxID=3198878 RepID=UPI0031592E3F